MRVCASILLCSVMAALAQSPSAPVQIKQLSRDVHARGSHLIHVNADVSGELVYYAVPTARLSDTPEWHGQGDPPIEMTAALRLARQHVEQKHPDSTSRSLTRGELFSIDHKSIPNRWSYRFEFRIQTITEHQIDRAFLESILTSVEGLVTPDQTTAKQTQYTTFFVFVLFDGGLIEAETFAQENNANNASEDIGANAPNPQR